MTSILNICTSSLSQQNAKDVEGGLYISRAFDLRVLVSRRKNMFYVVLTESLIHLFLTALL